jgi:NAD(P)H-hydrate epimerase
MQKLPAKLYQTEQIKELEHILIEERGGAGIELMEKAGTAVFDLIKREYKGHQISVFCGAGNNAGDGYVIARLALQSGFNVIVYSVSEPKSLRGDAMTAYQGFVQAGGQLTKLSIPIQLGNCLVIDALIGTGLSRNVTGVYAEIIQLINNASQPVISVDIPSGLHADTGNIMGLAVKADWTVSFIGLKQGLFTGFAMEYCGEIVYASLDIDDEDLAKVKTTTSILPSPVISKRHRCVHKGNNGHVLVIGGDVGYSGAIRLAAESALRVGAGLVSVATRKNHAALINVNRPELMCHGVECADELNSLINKASVIVIGPGLGQNEWGKKLFKRVERVGIPVVCDADALNILAGSEQKVRENWVLTPHPGEAARLLKCATQEIAVDRFSAISTLQKIQKGIMLLKGAGTLMTDGKETMVSRTGNPGMASGGMGDVLAGMIGGLVAQNMSIYNATKAAVYLHGKAADLSAQESGEIGLLASDLFPYIRKLVNQCS